jgi:hypothetical protein
MKPSADKYPGYFHQYIDLVPEVDLRTAIAQQQLMVSDFLNSISEEKSSYSYAAGKWTIKEMLQHIIDTERIFAYRALCFARKDPNRLPGFEENEYAANVNANARTWKNLVDEFLAIRKSFEYLFASFSDETLENEGFANNSLLNVMVIGFVTIGHFYHHKNIIEERYF